VLSFHDDQGTHHAAALIYYALMSLFPTLLLAVSLLGLLGAVSTRTSCAPRKSPVCVLVRYGQRTHPATAELTKARRPSNVQTHSHKRDVESRERSSSIRVL